MATRCAIIGERRHNANSYVMSGKEPLSEIIGLPIQSSSRLLQKAVKELSVVDNFTLN